LSRISAQSGSEVCGLAGISTKCLPSQVAGWDRGCWRLPWTVRTGQKPIGKWTQTGLNELMIPYLDIRAVEFFGTLLEWREPTSKSLFRIFVRSGHKSGFLEANRTENLVELDWPQQIRASTINQSPAQWTICLALVPYNRMQQVVWANHDTTFLTSSWRSCN
jgi:hypothetical protein